MTKMNYDRVRREAAMRGAVGSVDVDGTRKFAKSSSESGTKPAATTVRLLKKAKKVKRNKKQTRTASQNSWERFVCLYCNNTLPTMIREKHDRRCKAKKKAEAVAPKSKPEAVSQESKPEAVAQKSRPKAVAQESRPEAVAQKSKPKAVAQKSKPKAVAQKSKPKAVAQKSKPKAVAQKSKPKAVAQKSKPKAVAQRSKMLTPGEVLADEDAMSSGRTILGGHFEGNRRRH